MGQAVPMQAERLIEEAESIARSLGNRYLGVEHVFLAATRSNLLSDTFRAAGIEAEALERELSLLITRDEPHASQANDDSLPRTPRLKRVLDRAAEIALSQFHRELLPTHILESLLTENSGLVALACQKCNVNVETLHHHFAKPEQPASVTTTTSKKKQTQTPTLDRLGRDLTELAKEGKLDPVIGRTEELRRTMQILNRKKKNVPILIGEPGVGKTAVVYALAHRLAKGNVPKVLVGKRVIELPLGSIIAGTANRGDLEERIQKLIAEVSGDSNCIVFIDEIHGLIGGGNSKGSLDLANLLKPALADGSLRVIGATTTEEYQKYLIKDAALERRLQPVLVPEPSEEETQAILTGLKQRYEQHHEVLFDEEAIEQAIKFSVRYLPDRRLPDKALDLLDEAASRVKTKTGVSLPATVSREDIAEVVSLWTGIPVQKLSSDEKEKLLNLESHLKSKVIGQEEAVKKVSETIRISRAGLGNPKRPIGVFLFLGPTGVGKTELAKALAEALYGSQDLMVRLDMSEYKESHSGAKLIGSPPGYVGHEDEGQLTKAIHAKPYSLLLLDEIEKAHPEVLDLFLQIFDDGRLTDSKGRTVSFTNTLIIMTSNLASRQILAHFENATGQIRDEVFTEIKSFFRPEFLNRIDEIVIFNPLRKEDLQQIVHLQLKELQKRLQDQKLEMQVSPELIEFLIQKGYEPAFGARPMRRAVQQFLAKPLAQTILQGVFPEGSRILATLNPHGEVSFTIGGDLESTN